MAPAAIKLKRSPLSSRHDSAGNSGCVHFPQSSFPDATKKIERDIEKSLSNADFAVNASAAGPFSSLISACVLHHRTKQLLIVAALWLSYRWMHILCLMPAHPTSVDDIISALEVPEVPAGTALLSTSANGAQEITLVATWQGSQERPMNSFPLWMQTLSAQTVPLNLIWLNFYSDDHPGCYNISQHTPEWAQNVRELCVHRDELYDFITNTLCDKWGCTPAETALVFAHMRMLQGTDYNLVTMRPFLGHFLRGHIKTDWWAWIDSDQIMGDFGRTFPYDIMDQFDVITPAMGTRESFYLHGQLTAFRQSAMLEHLLSARAYSCPEEFIEKMQPDPNAEERFWSDALLLDERLRYKINWLQLKGKHNDLPYGERLVTHNGRILHFPLSATRATIEARFAQEDVIQPSFTPAGQTLEMNKTHDFARSCQYWNPIDFCPLIDHDTTRANKVFWMRRNGQYEVRLEPLEDGDSAPWHEEYMLQHFQCTKEWVRLPSAASIGGYSDAFVDFVTDGLEIWQRAQPERTIFSHKRPLHPPQDRGNYGYCGGW